jgi:flagellin
MSYLLTNASALTALQNLTNTQNSLATTQQQLSSGLKVANASDNSSYWSISQTMSSDNGALGAVNSSLAVNGSLVSTNTSALNQAITVVNNIKNELVSAQASGADLASIGKSIAASQATLKTIVAANSTNGQNFLEGTAGTVNRNTAASANSTYLAGVSTAAAAVVTQANANGGVSSALTNAADSAMTTYLGAQNASNLSAFNTAAASVTAAGGATAAQYSAALNAAVVAASAATAATNAASALSSNATNGTGSLGNSGSQSIISGYTEASGVTSISLNTANTTLIDDSGSGFANAGILTTAGTSGSSVMTMAVVGGAAPTSTASLAAMLTDVDRALSSMRTAATTLGAATNEITTQQTFLSSMQTNLTNGIASLVDADMNQVSTRLQALQTQQQLGVQSLSIANQSSQMILKLFQ